MDESPTGGTAEAEEAAAEAHNKSNDPDDIIDALEAAEAKYDEAHPDDAAGALIHFHFIHFIQAHAGQTQQAQLGMYRSNQLPPANSSIQSSHLACPSPNIFLFFCRFG